MPAFAYTTGNPNNLVANQNASMADIQGPFTDLRTFLNGGTMDETNVPNLSAAFTTYKRLERGAAQATNSTGVLVLNLTGVIATGLNNVGVNTVNATTSDYLAELDPTDYNANSRVTKLRLRFTIVTNATAPAVNYVAGLYPITGYGGAAGVPPFIQAVGTVVAGSTVTINAPAAAGRTKSDGTDFNFPAAGAYCLAVQPSGAAAANAVVHLIAQLQMRQV